ncbi:ribosomal-protein-alanine acetyltransferase [Enterococcus florum]|uniref:Ribosomal-protein-alanine acetyltransferase n=1 Tax=Enterococcus florum TaxID=2480627 RepID=A0A4P5P8M2_9ENTE|nr:ribosomal protein S18-alanine N-acetyltransferase [Enterococcus florum]GCF92288.1 ribosomal-protein-alanine acetyltransferase [Enterococcus florum]
MLKKFSGLIKTFFIRRSPLAQPKKVSINQEDYILRSIMDADIKELIALEKDVYFGETPWTKSAFLSEIHSPIHHLYACLIRQKEIVAFIGCRVIGNDTHITNVAVRRDAQNAGLGSYLIDEVEKFAIMNGCITLSLEVRVSNKDAQRLYRRLGFESLSIRRNYYTEDHEDALEMIKRLQEE